MTGLKVAGIRDPAGRSGDNVLREDFAEAGQAATGIRAVHGPRMTEAREEPGQTQIDPPRNPPSETVHVKEVVPVLREARAQANAVALAVSRKEALPDPVQTDSARNPPSVTVHVKEVVPLLREARAQANAGARSRAGSRKEAPPDPEHLNSDQGAELLTAELKNWLSIQREDLQNLSFCVNWVIPTINLTGNPAGDQHHRSLNSKMTRCV